MNKLIEALNSNILIQILQVIELQTEYQLQQLQFLFRLIAEKLHIISHRKKNNFYVSIVLLLKKPKSYF